MSKFNSLPGWLQAIILLTVITVAGVGFYNFGYDIGYELGQSGN